MDNTLGVAYILVCSIFIWLSIRMFIKEKKIILLPVLGILVVLTNFISIPAMQYVETTAFYIDEANAYKRTCIAGIIFMCVTAVLYRTMYKKNANNVINQSKNIQINDIMIALLGVSIIISALLTYRYLIMGNAIQYFGVVISSNNSLSDHYRVRSEVFQELVSEKGKGVGGSSIVMNIFVPMGLAIACYLYKMNKRKLYMTLGLCMLAFYILNAFILTHRSMLVIMCILPVVAYVYIMYASVIESKYITKNSVYYVGGFLMLLVIVMSFVYMITDSMPFTEALAQMFTRVFVTQAGTATWYYDLFPDYFGFRGIENVLSMDSGSINNPQDITFADVSYVATGARFCANVTFLAIAYTALGMYGVLIVSILVCGITGIIDHYIRRYSPELRAAIIVSCIVPLSFTCVGVFNMFTYMTAVILIIAVEIKDIRLIQAR